MKKVNLQFFAGTPSKRAYRINIKNPVFTLLTSDDDTACVYGKVDSLGEAMEIQITPTLATGTLYGNGAKVDDSAKITGIDMQFGATKIPIEHRATMLGNTYADGILVENKADQSVYIAFGYEVEQTNGKRECVWLLKGKAQPISSTSQQSESNINYSTDSIKISFIPRAFDGAIRAFGDTANEAFTEEKADTFFSAAPTTFVVK
ncbi:major tail protein [Lachnoclostridium sp.]|uniref:major tail protein n=1 Tax=Lachnoclostridium sp. TaxID=2028282 RepID=UPI00289BA821|nr:major tail protein [Lachnoclostridium sp.]